MSLLLSVDLHGISVGVTCGLAFWWRIVALFQSIFGCDSKAVGSIWLEISLCVRSTYHGFHYQQLIMMLCFVLLFKDNYVLSCTIHLFPFGVH